MSQTAILRGDVQRAYAKGLIDDAPVNAVVIVKDPTRSNEQNAMFHAICADIAKSGQVFFGKARDAEEWKALLISGHAVATKSVGEVIPGIEGELVAIRESSARMSVRRAASLISYTIAYCDTHGIPLTERYAA